MSVSSVLPVPAKSTLLRCINQLETPTAGEIEYDGKSITGGEMKTERFS